jgi:hypothetical protein
MKKIRILGILLTVLAITVISMPVSAATTSTCTIGYGIEIFPGIDIGSNNYGATFVAQVSNSGGALDLTKGVLNASINYEGTDPDPNHGNKIFGGNWTLTVTSNGKSLGTIIGKVKTGSVSWDNNGTNNPTARGTVHLELNIVGGTKQFASIPKGGDSSFDGFDNHESHLYIGKIQIPTVSGNLYLAY